MSVDWLFLIPVPKSSLADDYLDVDDAFRGSDYVIVAGGPWDPRVQRSASLRHAMAVELTREHLAALRASKPPREIVVTTDAGAPHGRGKSYAVARKQWLASRAFLLPDVVEEVVTSHEVANAAPRLRPSDVRIPLPAGARTARLRRLDPVFALQQLHGRGKVAPKMASRVRAGVVLIEVDGQDLESVARHYRASLKALGMRTREEGPSKWIEERFVQMRGRSENVEVSVMVRPSDRERIDVSVLWVERGVTAIKARRGSPRG